MGNTASWKRTAPLTPNDPFQQLVDNSQIIKVPMGVSENEQESVTGFDKVENTPVNLASVWGTEGSKFSWLFSALLGRVNVRRGGEF
ncbi:hypothetical protein BaRGS_00021081 [Batillaria attramentaria]|uniref:Uncharacterized protein n=1 Tax=Batillaria attramentaria TaxID=370345 RepID=A0ABD0KKY5_9CAEN